MHAHCQPAGQQHNQINQSIYICSSETHGRIHASQSPKITWCDSSTCVQLLALTLYQAAIMLWHWQPSKIQLSPESLLLLLLWLTWHQMLHRTV
jgi:hypothetical protein